MRSAAAGASPAALKVATRSRPARRPTPQSNTTCTTGGPPAALYSASKRRTLTRSMYSEGNGLLESMTADQAPETAAKWFAGQGDLTLVAVDAEAVGADLRWEPSRGGMLFPHLYAPLRMSAVRWSRPWEERRTSRHSGQTPVPDSSAKC